jgi:hypothetical protein
MKLKPPIFYPYNFPSNTADASGVTYCSSDYHAKTVNTRLTEWWSEVMKDAQVVYGCYKSVWYDEGGTGATQRALLIGIEPIKECEHEPDESLTESLRDLVYVMRCRKCGVKLKSKGWIAE